MPAADEGLKTRQRTACGLQQDVLPCVKLDSMSKDKKVLSASVSLDAGACLCWCGLRSML